MCSRCPRKRETSSLCGHLGLTPAARAPIGARVHGQPRVHSVARQSRHWPQPDARAISRVPPCRGRVARQARDRLRGYRPVATRPQPVDSPVGPSVHDRCGVGGRHSFHCYASGKHGEAPRFHDAAQADKAAPLPAVHYHQAGLACTNRRRPRDRLVARHHQRCGQSSTISRRAKRQGKVSERNRPDELDEGLAGWPCRADRLTKEELTGSGRALDLRIWLAWSIPRKSNVVSCFNWGRDGGSYVVRWKIYRRSIG